MKEGGRRRGAYPNPYQIAEHYGIERRCEVCRTTDDLCSDHLRNDGSNAMSNMQILCKSCNSSKGASDYMEWLPRRADTIAAEWISRWSDELKTEVFERLLADWIIQRAGNQWIASFYPISRARKVNA